MNLEEKIGRYRETIQVKPQEEKIQETISRSKDAFFMAEQEKCKISILLLQFSKKNDIISMSNYGVLRYL